MADTGVRTTETRFWNPELPAGAFDDPDHRRDHFDHLNEELTRGRFIRVAGELRGECPVAHSDAHEDGFYSVARYRDVEYVHMHLEEFSSCPVSIPPVGNPRPMAPIESDPPLHKGYRRILTDVLSKPTQKGKEELYRGMASELIDAFVDRGECDVAEELCIPLTLNALMDTLGVPGKDRAMMGNISNRMVHRTGGAEDTALAVQELYGYFTELVAIRREDPREDIVSSLCHAEIDGEPLALSEILDVCAILVPAGFETTASSMSYMFLLLAEQPELADRLQADPSLIPAALEELLRYSTPVRGLARTVVADVELSGRKLQRGDRLHLNWLAANHDPEVFDAPGEIRIDRKPNRHMGFGLGPHLCMGIHMARAEMKVAFEETLRRMTNIRLQDVDRVVETTGPTWGLTQLPITFDRV
jgi:cytochrome P450